ncbi:hypothetical protein U9M48_006475 [Paspalum notatum var. saurae]|uniref:DNA glycosylase superfamily protein n=1 Tax=Paspalum notatum var. saurae TaxID=547442 RepID=A0AAQ3PSD5_PASNO
MEVRDELRSFEATGVYRLDGTGTVATFVDPVRLINASYQRFRVVPSAYYSRSFAPHHQKGEPETEPTEGRRKRKRNHKSKPTKLNAREQIAEARHKEARPLLLSAHESFVKAKHLLEYLSKTVKGKELGSGSQNNFVELGTSWRAPFYEITLFFREPHVLGNEEGSFHAQKTSFPLFNSIISVEAIDEAEGEFQNRRYILPRGSCFLMADFRRVRDLIPVSPNQGYNLIVVDPPWENGCVRQKEAYPTLPNRYLLYLPVQELAHPDGALLVLWITNREKLRVFVEKELLPSWAVKDPTVFYWLKVKPDGSLMGDLDLFHHRPYECLLLGYINVNTDAKQGSDFKLLEGSQNIFQVLSLQDASSFFPESCFLDGPLGEMSRFIFRIPSTSQRNNLIGKSIIWTYELLMQLQLMASALWAFPDGCWPIPHLQMNMPSASAVLLCDLSIALVDCSLHYGDQCTSGKLKQTVTGPVHPSQRAETGDSVHNIAVLLKIPLLDLSELSGSWWRLETSLFAFIRLVLLSCVTFRRLFSEDYICILQSNLFNVHGKMSESPSPELRRIRTALPTASSKVAVAIGRAKRAERPKAPANSKAKGLDDKEKQGKNGRLVPSAARRISPPPPPPAVSPDAGKTRCSWITSNSDPLYVAFHDEEWGVPSHDDRMLFELLTLSQALAELTWPAILSKREEFREMFDGFNFASVSEFTEKKISLLRSNGIVVLSEQKIRAVVTNAKQMHKVVKEFGSFSNYCWSFVNHRPITNVFRHARQIPTKTPKAEAISKDLMRRGFQCVGPTTIYSFMQVAGIVNDHVSCCFRFQACSQHKTRENNVRAEPALPDGRLGSPPSEDSDIREM